MFLPSDDAIDLTVDDDDDDELTLDSQFLSDPAPSAPAPVVIEKKLEPVPEQEDDPLADFEAWLKSDAVVITG